MCCIKVARPRRGPHDKQGERLMPGYAGLSVLGQYVPIPLACAPGGSAPPLMWKPLCFQESRSVRRLGLTCLPSRRACRKRLWKSSMKKVIGHWSLVEEVDGKGVYFSISTKATEEL